MRSFLRLVAACAGSGPAQRPAAEFNAYVAIDLAETDSRINDQPEKYNEADAYKNLRGFRH